jgi:hypothetical protein
MINGLADFAERIQPLLATLALVEKLANRLFDQLIGALVSAASEFLLDLVSQIRRQRYVHDRLLPSFYALSPATSVGHVEISKEENAEAGPCTSNAWSMGPSDKAFSIPGASPRHRRRVVNMESHV